MSKAYKLREITENDSKVLMDWRNDQRQNFFTSDEITVSQHQEYIKQTLRNPKRVQFILENNNVKVGTIREDDLGGNEYELSYTVSRMHQSQGIGKIMIELYLSSRKGSFLCRIKEENHASINLVEKLGFKVFKSENEISFFKLIQK
jgi:RimJ/RimL family protein N-acetyltransferase